MKTEITTSKKSVLPEKSKPLAVSRSACALRDMAEKAMKKGEMKEALAPGEYAQLIGGYIHDATRGLRSAVFVAHFALAAGKGGEVKKLLSSKYAIQTISDIFSAAKNIIPALRSIGALNYRDPNNLRTVGKVLRNPSSPAYAVVCEAILANKPVSAVRQARSIIEGEAVPFRRPVVALDAPCSDSKVRDDIRAACRALAAMVGGGRASTFLCGIASEIQGIQPQASVLQAA